MAQLQTTAITGSLSVSGNATAVSFTSSRASGVGFFGTASFALTPAGTSGTAGSSGANGSSGSSGTSGTRGSSGSSGANGSSGSSGASGSSGSSGANGSSGSSGANGSSGSSGASGSSGTSGTRGSSGSSGANGSSGSSGASGSSGTSGTRGSSGSSGANGTSGSSGANGSSGSSGANGSSGSSGANGSSGSSGANGSSGSSGANGAAGTSGTSGTRGSSGSSGTSATVTINGNVNDYVITATGTAATFQGEANLRFTGNSLHVTSSTADPNIILFDSTSGFDPHILFVPSQSANTFALGVDDSDSDKFKLSYSTALGTNDRLVVDTTGNVGIGTTSPAQLLHVAGDINVSTGQGFRINNTATSGQYLRGNGTRFVSSAIQAGDVPALNQNTTGTAANVTGIVAIANGGTGATTAAAARTGLGATTVGANVFTLTNPSAVTFLRVNADNTVSTLDAATFRTAIGAGTGNGTVTGVTGTSPVASSGGTAPAISLAAGYGDTQNPYASKTAKFFLAAPNAANGVPTFRAIVASDIPTLNQNTSGTAANITATSNTTLTSLANLVTVGTITTGTWSASTIAVNRGGTGATSFTAGHVLFGNGTSAINSSANLFWDNTNARLGIGTTSLGANLSIGSSLGTFTGLSIGFAANSDIRIGQGASNNAILAWKYNATAASAYAILETFGGSNPLCLQTSGGNVGIGTTSPSARLHVSADSTNDILRLQRIGSAAGAGFIYANSNEVFGVHDGTNYPFLVKQGSSTETLVVNGSQVGVGTVSPNAKLQVYAGTAPNTGLVNFTNNAGSVNQNLTFHVGARLAGTWPATVDNSVVTLQSSGTNAMNMAFATGNNEQMRITTGGNVGIGTTNPGARLHVAGTGSGGDDYVLLLAYNNPGGAVQAVQNQSSTGWSIIRFLSDTGTRMGSVGGGNSGAFVLSNTMYITSQNNYPLVFGTGTGAVPTERMRIDPSGNVGIGVTPSAWSGFKPALQIGTFSLSQVANRAYLTANGFWDGSAWKYIATDYASEYRQENGQHIWQTAPSGTAGNAITFTQAMTLDASGKLGIGSGATSPNANLHVAFGSASVDATVLIQQTTNGTAAVLTLAANNDGGAGYNFIRSVTSGGTEHWRIDGGATSSTMVFKTNATERARITSGGYFKASNDGVYVSSTGAYHEIRNTANSHALRVTSTNTSQTAEVLWVGASRSTSNGSYYLAYFFNEAAGNQFRILDSGNAQNTNNSYGGLSDIKLKQDIVDATSQWEDLKDIRVRKFRFKHNPEGPLQIGVVAQELEQVSPGLVESSVDYEDVEIVDENGNITTERQPTGTVTKSVKYSVLYMKSIKALQEAMHRIEVLEAQNTELVPLLVEAIKEQQHQIQHQAQELAILKALLENK
jgi:hypothetical protein